MMTELINDETIWYLVRSSGTVAYLFMAASTIWGLVISSKFLKEIVPGSLSLAMHNYLSWNAIGLTVLHAVLLLFSGYMDYSVVNLLVPFTGPYSPFWVGLGIIGLYLGILTTLTFYIRSRIGYKTFHLLHYLTYGAFVLSLLHSWFAGTDTAVLEATYLITGLLVFFLTAYRVLTAFTDRRTAMQPQQA
ncbi:MAG: ferric reductase-like transmembrane domain-containing protein [Ardenticatenaceae bacterium]|nr:ferric reductase-like transmembrane domain-containing protein [Ardenticatenaceae bacterium]